MVFFVSNRPKVSLDFNLTMKIILLISSKNRNVYIFLFFTNIMAEEKSVNLESQTAYLGRFGVLKDFMLQGIATISYLQQPKKNSSIILITSDTINSSALNFLAEEIKLYDSLLESSEKQHNFKRPFLTTTGLYSVGNPYFFDTEEMVDYLEAYSNYLVKKKDPKIISTGDLAHFSKQPLSSKYKIVKPTTVKKTDIVDGINSVAENILYYSFQGMFGIISKVLQSINSTYVAYKKFDSWLDRKFFDKYKIN